MDIPIDYVFVSFDVTSLFTNISKEALIKSEKNWDLISTHTLLTLQPLKTISMFLFDNSYFSYRIKCYQQVYGSATGNPASPTLANLVMNDILIEFSDKMNFELPVLMYMDDILACISKEKIELCLETLNCFSSELKFTCELENNCQIPGHGKCVVDYYRKPTSSSRILNFHSITR